MIFLTTKYLRHNHKLAEVTLFSKPSKAFTDVLDDDQYSLEVTTTRRYVTGEPFKMNGWWGPAIRILHVEGREWHYSEKLDLDFIHSYRLLPYS